MSQLDEIVGAAARCLREGGLVALPTETVYGLGADAANDAAVLRIFSVKGRPAHHPLIVHLSAGDDPAQYAAGDPRELHMLAERFWPGPLTVIVRKSTRISDLVTGDQPTVALRVPDHPLTLAILKEFNGVVAAPSANRFGRVSPTTAGHVRDDLGADVDLVVDGGQSRFGVESTIIDLSGAVPAILRAGAIGPTALSNALGVTVAHRSGGSVRAPGMQASHYAPRARLIILDAAQLDAEVAGRSARNERVAVLTLPDDPAAAARELYATLRVLDRSGAEVLLASLPSDIEANAAVRDRLTRASFHEGA